ncbi:dromaiocalcin-1-like [Heterodontus francisci]|uniref:dromaiocalcin-1-like n=1 Tax=Heterodontus francisci TaxID=7792 RepID=UPI00355B19CD
MMLVMVLVLSELLISDVTARVALNGTMENGEPETETDWDQNLEKRGIFGRGLCSDGWFYLGYCYKYYSQERLWIIAEIYCHGLNPGGHLASIHSKVQNQFIGQVIHATDPSDPETWIGLNDLYKEGTWFSTDGSLMDFSNWYKGEPDNGGEKNEHCVRINHGMPLKWSDEKCGERNGFICSYKLHQS